MDTLHLLKTLNERFLAQRPAMKPSQLYGHRVAAIFAVLKSSLRSNTICATQLECYCALLQDEMVSLVGARHLARSDVQSRLCTRLVAALICRLKGATARYATGFARLLRDLPLAAKRWS